MLQNRYDETLRKYNQNIINLGPANQTMRIELALEIKKLLTQNPDTKVLEIGVGEGDSTKDILQHNPGIQIDCLDISPEMIASAKKILGAQSQNINFIQDDAYEFLDKRKNDQYGIITSSWTIHNFPWEEKEKLFAKIFDSLTPDGTMLLMDKIYTDNNIANNYLLRIQNARYKYLPNIAQEAILNHELQDFGYDYKMKEPQVKNFLYKTGFRTVEFLDRIERDVLLLAKK